MTLSRVDCDFYSGKSESSSFVGFCPRLLPGSIVVAGAAAVRDSIGSQVASKLSLQHFTEGVQQFYGKLATEPREETQISLGVLEEAFRNANSLVYNFGHKLAAGGRMAASLISVVLEAGVMASGRVGPGSSYLCRRGEIFPFFEPKAAADDLPGDSYLGAHSLVSVELASVSLEGGDKVLMFSEQLDIYQEREIGSIVSELEADGSLSAQAVVSRLFPDGGSMSFAMLLSVGPQTIFLNDVVV